LEHHTEENDSLSLLWTTPVASDTTTRKTKYKQGGSALSYQVNGMWPTPTVCGNGNRKGSSPTSGDGLSTVVNKQAMWPTPNSRDYKDTPGMNLMANGEGKDGRKRIDLLPRLVYHTGQLLPEHINTTGSHPEPSPLLLNPIWVLQLMGTDLEQTFFVWQEMP
jgi:hypothetical protein